jgi:aspartate/glutamate/aspartate-prephenate aminotransferase
MVNQAPIAFVQGPVAASATTKVATTLRGVPEAFDSLKQVFRAVHSEEARFAVVAIENSATGTAHAVYDLLLEYGLRIVLEHQEVTPEGMTRFVSLAKFQDVGTFSGMLMMNSTAKVAHTVRTSLVLSFPLDLDTKASHLHRALGVLVKHNVELIKVESRLKSGGVLFSVDIVGSETSAQVSNALADLRKLTHLIHVLGSYVDTTNMENAKSPRASQSKTPATNTPSMADKYPLNPMVTDAPLGRNLMIVGMAKQMEAAGEQVHSLAIGETDFLPPPRAIEAGVRALQQGKVKYSQLRGEPSLRELIATYLDTVKGVTYDPNTEIQVTAGAQQALYHALYTLIRPGDKVILPSPSWAAYEAIITQVRAGLVRLRGNPEDDYLINPQALEDALTANPTAKVLMLCNPSNPAGTLHLPHHLERIAEVLRKPEFRHVVVIADEIYEQIVYQDEGQPKRVHQCFATLPGMRERTVIVNGFSKAYAMAGLRIGFIAAPSYFVEPCMVLQGHFTSTASTIGQLAAAEALREELEMFERGESRVAPELEKLNAKRQYITRRLGAIPNVKFAYPTAAFYLFMDLSAYFEGKRAFATSAHGAIVAKEQAEVIHDVAEFCEFVLREYHVALSPGVDFGEDFGVRISYAAKMETVAHGMDALEHALQSLTFEEA